LSLLLQRIRGRRIALDTMAFIYLFEDDPVYASILKPLFHAVERGDIHAVTSTLTIAECLVHPLRKADHRLAATYRMVFRTFPNLTVVPVSEDVAEQAAILRARVGLRTPDAVQVATALSSGVGCLVTNDEGLRAVPKPEVLVLEDFRV
jgi:predicted nucleic acid-binding protein